MNYTLKQIRAKKSFFTKIFQDYYTSIAFYIDLVSSSWPSVPQSSLIGLKIIDMLAVNKLWFFSLFSFVNSEDCLFV